MNNYKQIYQPGQQKGLGSIQPEGFGFDTPNHTLSDISMEEEMVRRTFELIFTPSPHTEIYLDVEYNFNSPTHKAMSASDISHTIEDLIYFLRDQNLLSGKTGISFGGAVEERSGSETSIDSYYYQGGSGIDVMTVEGDVTTQSIRTTAENMISELQRKGLL